MKRKVSSLWKGTLFILLWMISLSMYAQNITVKGTVNDTNGEPLIGVTIQIEEENRGTVTDIDGNFTLLNVPTDAILEVTYVGMNPQRIQLAGRSSFVIVMEEDSELLDELVVVGYGTQKKIHMTGAVSQVSGEVLKKAPTGNISAIMQGRIPGLISKQQSGQPGNDGANMYIRGVGSGSILYVIDGVQSDFFPNLAADEIESITILKDAASQAVFGLRGSGGVVVITTKRGDSDKPTINFSSSLSLSQNANFPEFLNGLEYATWYNKAQELDGVPEVSWRFSAEEIDKIQNGDPDGVYGNTDWFDLLFNNSAPSTSNTLSISGRSNKVNYYGMFDVYNQQGIIDRTSYDRYSARINLDMDVTDNFKASMSLTARRNEAKEPGLSASGSGYAAILPQAMLSFPFLMPFNAEGEPIASYNTEGNGDNNPLAARDLSGQKTTRGNTLDAQSRIDYSVPFISGLKISLDGAYKKSDNMIKVEGLPYYVQVYNQQAKTWNKQFSRARSSGMASVQQWFTEREIFNVRPEIHYNKKIQKHEISSLLFYEYRRIQDTSMSLGKRGYPIQDIMDINFGEEIEENLIGGGHALAREAGYGVRINYAFADKYLAEFVGRYDASVYLPSETRWGFFPGVSLGWRVSEESFFKDRFGETVDNLKIRSSYGRLGNDAGMGYTYFSTAHLSQNNEVMIGNILQKYLNVGGVPNYGLMWPVKDDWNLGFEAMLWKGLLGIEFDVFYSLWSQQYSSVADFPPSMGGFYPNRINYGKTENRGVELMLSHRNKIGDFSYNVKGNLTWARNKVLKLSQDPYKTKYTSSIGKPTGQIWGFIAEGLFQSQEELDESAVFGPTKVGDIKLRDINGDGRITFEQDQVPIGRSSIPEMIFGLDLGGEYKNFDFNMFLQGASLFDVEVAGMYTDRGFKDHTFYTRPFFAGGNSPRELIENSWTPENPNAKYPRLGIELRSNGSAHSSLYVQDGTYLRLKSAQIGYNIPKNIVNNMGAQNLRFYISGTNLFTLSGLDFGLDPEMPSVNQGYYPPQRIYEFGLNLTF